MIKYIVLFFFPFISIYAQNQPEIFPIYDSSMIAPFVGQKKLIIVGESHFFKENGMVANIFLKSIDGKCKLLIEQGPSTGLLLSENLRGKLNSEQIFGFGYLSNEKDFITLLKTRVKDSETFEIIGVDYEKSWPHTLEALTILLNNHSNVYSDSILNSINNFMEQNSFLTPSKAHKLFSNLIKIYLNGMSKINFELREDSAIVKRIFRGMDLAILKTQNKELSFDSLREQNMYYNIRTVFLSDSGITYYFQPGSKHVLLNGFNSVTTMLINDPLFLNKVWIGEILYRANFSRTVFRSGYHKFILKEKGIKSALFIKRY